MLTTLFIFSLFIILILIAKILIIPRKTIEIKKSKIENAGRGVFALKRFYEKQLVEECPTLLEDKKNMKGIFNKYYFEVKNNKNKGVFALGNCGLYNHSYNPNAKYYSPNSNDKSIKIFANRTIKPGEEITINYGKKYWNKLKTSPS